MAYNKKNKGKNLKNSSSDDDDNGKILSKIREMYIYMSEHDEIIDECVDIGENVEKILKKYSEIEPCYVNVDKEIENDNDLPIEEVPSIMLVTKKNEEKKYYGNDMYKLLEQLDEEIISTIKSGYNPFKIADPTDKESKIPDQKAIEEFMGR